jgi:hypothetical protein
VIFWFGLSESPLLCRLLFRLLRFLTPVHNVGAVELLTNVAALGRSIVRFTALEFPVEAHARFNRHSPARLAVRGSVEVSFSIAVWNELFFL